MVNGCQCEEEYTCVNLPESAAGDEAFGPAFWRAEIGFCAYGGVFSCYQAHALEFGEDIAGLEDSFFANSDAPVAFRAARFGGLGRGRCREMR